MDPMLIESGLFGRGLVSINTQKGVAMFNEALESLGIEPTKLKQFDIDGIGWSPQIAAERTDPSYMGAGSTKFAIIATPEQEGKPIHVPFYSFKRRLERQYFDRFKREINDTTTSNCLVQEFIHSPIVVENPKDFVYMDEVLVHSSAGSLMEQVSEQRRLADAFLAPGTAWFHKTLRDVIIASAKEHGDLRRRRCEFPDFKFSLIGNYWARFEGKMVFVLRVGNSSILIVEDEAWLEKIQPEKGERYKAFALSNRAGILECLLEEDLIELDLRSYQKNPELKRWLEQLIHYVEMDAVCELEPKCDYAALSQAKRSKILVGNKNKIAMLAELQRLKTKLESPVSGRALPRLSNELTLPLLRPNGKETSERYQNILWMLLLRLQDNPPDPLLFYKHDKERFFSLFETWPIAKKRWVSSYVSANYVPEMNAEPANH